MVRHGTFRDGSYSRYVFWGKRTVKQGECLSEWNLSGQQKIILGPRRKYLFRSNIRFLDRHQADQRQYLVILHSDGRREHIRGPVALFEDPVLHQSIKTESVIAVDGFEALVVYKEEIDSKVGVERRIVRGPTQFMPDANEWVHVFSWHGVDKSGTISAGANKFSKLTTIPDQILYDTEVRTNDDVLLTLKLIIFYEMISIENMLDCTNDPIGDLINALGADLITFAAKVTYEKFLEVSAISLNDTATFSMLTQRAASIGFSVSKVVYRGYAASRDMQIMHETTVRDANQMRGAHEAAVKKQELEDFKALHASERAAREREIRGSEHAEMMRQKEVEYEQVIRHRQMELEMEELSIKKRNEEQVAFLEKLKSLGVSLTQYLVAERSKVDKVIRVEAPGGTASTLLIDTK